MLKTSAYAAFSPASLLVPHAIERREPGPHDVLIDTLSTTLKTISLRLFHVIVERNPYN